MKNIRVSIITPCFNSESTIERTIKSVFQQKYENLEYLIIDGGSTDRTLEIAEKYKPLFGERLKVISEPDNGIYDAMNKGIGNASGELIGIINSDDAYEPDAVENIVSAMNGNEYQILYGMMRIIRDGIETKVTMPKHENLAEEMIAHPTCFVTKKVYTDFGMFDTKYRSCADHDFMLRMREHPEVSFVPVYKILAAFTEGTGMSSKGSSMMEAFGMLREHGMISKRQYRSISVSYHLKKLKNYKRIYMEQITNKSIITNFIWRFMERCGAKLVSFVVSMVLARLLDPDTYGTIALVLVIITVLDVFVDSGLGNALIQKKGADDLDFSTVFYFNVAVCLVLYLIVFAAAPLIAGFYSDDSLIPLIRVLSLHIVLSGVKNVQYAYVSKTMQFKRFFFSTLGGTLGAAVVGVWLAYRGYGVWALVAQHLFNSFVDMVILGCTVKWRPKRMFSLERLKGLFSFGWKLLASSLLETIYQNLTQLIIGKLDSASDLAYYNRGNQFPSLIVLNVNTSIDSVLMPAMSNEQDNVIRVKNMTRRAIKTSTYIMAPLMVGLACCGTRMIRLLLTEKWLPCVPYLQIFCIIYLTYPIHTANLNAIKAMGRSDLFLKLEIIKKILGVALLAVTMWHGTMAMAYGMLLSYGLSIIINSWPNRKLLKYGYKEQLRDILPEIALAAVMGIVVILIGKLQIPDMIALILQVMAGALLYVGGSAALKLDSFVYLWNTISPYIKRSSEKKED